MGELARPTKNKLRAAIEAIHNRINRVCLTLGNTTAYTPTADYHPATKKYVDDETAGIAANTTHSTGDGSDHADVAANTAAIAAIKPRLVYSFGYPSAITGANNQELEPGHRAISGDQAAKGHLMPRAGSVLSVAIIVDINISGALDLPFKVRTDDDTDLLTETFVKPGVGNGHKQYNTFASGTHTFSAGEVLCARMDVPSGMTTDDIIMDVEVDFDT